MNEIQIKRLKKWNFYETSAVTGSPCAVLCSDAVLRFSLLQCELICCQVFYYIASVSCFWTNLLISESALIERLLISWYVVFCTYTVFTDSNQNSQLWMKSHAFFFVSFQPSRTVWVCCVRAGRRRTARLDRSDGSCDWSSRPNRRSWSWGWGSCKRPMKLNSSSWRTWERWGEQMLPYKSRLVRKRLVD